MGTQPFYTNRQWETRIIYLKLPATTNTTYMARRSIFAQRYVSFYSTSSHTKLTPSLKSEWVRNRERLPLSWELVRYGLAKRLDVYGDATSSCWVHSTIMIVILNRWTLHLKSGQYICITVLRFLAGVIPIKSFYLTTENSASPPTMRETIRYFPRHVRDMSLLWNMPLPRSPFVDTRVNRYEMLPSFVHLKEQAIGA